MTNKHSSKCQSVYYERIGYLKVGMKIENGMSEKCGDLGLDGVVEIEDGCEGYTRVDGFLAWLALAS